MFVYIQTYIHIYIYTYIYIYMYIHMHTSMAIHSNPISVFHAQTGSKVEHDASWVSYVKESSMFGAHAPAMPQDIHKPTC